MPRLRTFATLLRPALYVGLGALLHAACENRTPVSRAAPAQTKEQGELLARIDDVVITVGDFQERINKQSPYVRARYTSLERKKEFLDNLVRFEVLAKEARARGIDKDDEVVRTMKQVMIQKLMHTEFETKVKLDDVSDADCKKYFDTHPDEFNQAEEVRVAHILLKDEKTARKVLADPRLKGQENDEFRKLVAEYSTDGETRERGGDLRYFNAQDKALPPELVKAAFALGNINDVTAQPIRTSAGYHVLKLTGRRKALVRAFQEVQTSIRNRLFRDRRQTAMEDFIKGLRTKANVEVHEERLAKVVIEPSSGGFPGPGVPAPKGGEFHPGGGNAPQATPFNPGLPGGAATIVQPPAKEPPAPAPAP